MINLVEKDAPTFCFHNWSKWSEVTDTSYTHNKRQFRVCSKCNLVKSRVLGLGDQYVPASVINKLVKDI